VSAAVRLLAAGAPDVARALERAEGVLGDGRASATLDAFIG
jgi:anthranilate phosphoribosyltransferase